MSGLWSQADIDELKAAIKKGVLSVSYSGPPSRSITYQSLTEMRKLLAEMVADVAQQDGRAPYRLVKTTKGFS